MRGQTKGNEKKGRIKRRFAPMLRADSGVLRDDTAAVVYGCRKILRYEEDRICLSAPRRCVCVRGRGLICTAFSAGAVTVEGSITSVCFCPSDCVGRCKEGGETL